ncbi:MAG: hypothetical protein ACRC7O_02245 [Fimbriiglobus sp.]
MPTSPERDPIDTHTLKHFNFVRSVYPGAVCVFLPNMTAKNPKKSSWFYVTDGCGESAHNVIGIKAGTVHAAWSNAAEAIRIRRKNKWEPTPAIPEPGLSPESKRAVIDVVEAKAHKNLAEIDLLTGKDQAVEAFRAALELNHQLKADLCGQQREYALPRAAVVAKWFMTRYPMFMLDAMAGAKDGWGDLINPDAKEPTDADA